MAHFSHHGGICRLIRNPFGGRTGSDDFWFGAAAEFRSVLQIGNEFGSEAGQTKPGGDHRWRPRADGGGQSWRRQSERQVDWTEYRAAARTGSQPLRKYSNHLSLFLFTQSLLREIQHRIHLHAGWFWD